MRPFGVGHPPYNQSGYNPVMGSARPIFGAYAGYQGPYSAAQGTPMGQCPVAQEQRFQHWHLANHPGHDLSHQTNHHGLLLTRERGASHNPCRTHLPHLCQRNPKAEVSSNHQGLHQGGQARRHPYLSHQPRTRTSSYRTRCLGADPEQMRFRYYLNQRHPNRTEEYKLWKKKSEGWRSY